MNMENSAGYWGKSIVQILAEQVDLMMMGQLRTEWYSEWIDMGHKRRTHGAIDSAKRVVQNCHMPTNWGTKKPSKSAISLTTLVSNHSLRRGHEVSGG